MNLESKNKKQKSSLFNFLSGILKNFSFTEKVIFFFFLIIFIISALSSLIKINNNFLVKIPQKGGEIREGLIGIPRFINPIIAISDTDRDLSSLIYSGLLKINSNGDLVNDLAESFVQSENGLNYSVKIRNDAFFHDGKPVTVDDLIFTIEKTQDPAIKSPKRPNWDAISIEKISDKEVNFSLKQQYSAFAYNLTLGILPKHIWNNVSVDEFAFSKYNTEPVGAGPYKIDKVKKDSDGIVEKYYLKSNSKYTLGEPYISRIIFKFYKNEDEIIEALNKNNIDSAHTLSPEKIQEIILENKKINKSLFSRVFALYFNKDSSEILSNLNVRKAISLITPQKEIIETILLNYANPTNSPIPKNNLNASEIDMQKAKEILEKDGWVLGENNIYKKDSKELKFSISTTNVDELIKVTELLAKKYREFGIDIDVKIFEPNDLMLNVIRPRNFESIFFGQVVNRDMDFYGFWHSSQRNDPGLNIVGYTNIEADKALEKIRQTNSDSEKKEGLQIFEKEVINELPAIFLYSPNFIYITSNKLNLVIPQNVITSADRFSDIEKWYVKTDLVWKILAK